MVAKNKHSDNQFSEDTRLALLEQSINHLNSTLMRFENRFDQIDAKFNQMDSKFEKLDSRIDSNFKWLLSIIIAGFGSTLGIIAHVQHWI